MKLSWTDLVTTLFVLSGGAVVYAKFYNYSWAVIGSWRSATAVLAGLGLGMFAFSRFNFRNFSLLNMGELLVAAVAIGLAITAMIVTSEPMFYILASMLGALWLVDTARHFYHNLVDTSTFGHHVPVH